MALFIDEAKIQVKAGNGGNGCISLYRDKYQRRGIPDGGDGGKGADVAAVCDPSLFTLLDYRYRQHFVGKNGKHASSNNKKGRNADELIIKLPCGTVIRDEQTNCRLAELISAGDRVVLVKGGDGGSGNKHDRSGTKAKGAPGQERYIKLDLKLIADVGLVGFPNAGKSTLVSAISNAHPKTASFPFTTKSPALGVVSGPNRSFMVADIPGLIEGSHQGRGLGDRFLRHVERTKLIVHIIDMAGTDGRDPVQDYKKINKELTLFSKNLGRLPQIVAANKMDIAEAKANLVKFKQRVKIRIYPISALNKQGLEKLIETISKKLPTHSS